MNKQPLIIAIDGPLASGKGTIAKALAAHYQLPHLDTGALYRAVALAMRQKNLDWDDAQMAADVAAQLDLGLTENPEIRTAEIGAGASVVAAHTLVRQALYDVQRQFAFKGEGGVLDGRDIGTVICPEAPVKIYVTASALARAKRRHQELAEKGETISLEEMVRQLEERDARDMGRKDAPLRPAEDSHLLDTSEMTIDAAVNAARAIVDAWLLSLG